MKKLIKLDFLKTQIKEKLASFWLALFGIFL